MKKTFVTITQAGFSVILLILLFQGFDWGEFANVYRRLPLGFYLASLSAIALGQILYSLKWFVVLRSMGMEIPFGSVLANYLIAVFFNNFLPTAIGGDTARVYYLGRDAGYFRIAGSVLIDRFLGLFALTIFSVALAWGLDVSSLAYSVARNVLTVVALLFLLVFAAANLLSPGQVLSWQRLGNGFWADLVEKLSKLFSRVQMVSRDMGTLAAVLGIVLVYFLLLTLIYTVYFDLAASTQPSFWATMSVLLSIGVLANIPISVNGIGLREQLHFLLFASLGVPKEIAVSVSILIFSNLMIMSFVGYLVWLRYRGRP